MLFRSVQKPVNPEVLYEVVKYVMGDDAVALKPVVAAVQDVQS